MRNNVSRSPAPEKINDWSGRRKSIIAKAGEAAARRGATMTRVNVGSRALRYGQLEDGPEIECFTMPGRKTYEKSNHDTGIN